MCYDRKGYLRRSKGIVNPPSKEECQAYELIKNKWDIDNSKIRSLLNEYTLTEILEGDFEGPRFIPGKRLSMKSPMFPILFA